MLLETSNTISVTLLLLCNLFCLTLRRTDECFPFQPTPSDSWLNDNQLCPEWDYEEQPELCDDSETAASRHSLGIDELTNSEEQHGDYSAAQDCFQMRDEKDNEVSGNRWMNCQ